MAESWWPAICFLLTSLSVCCTSYPRQRQQTGVSSRVGVTAGDGRVSAWPAETLGQGRVKRQAAECPVLEVKGERGFQKIITSPPVDKYSFFIEPRPGFKSLVFRMKLDNKLIPGPWKYHSDTLIISSSRLHIDWSHVVPIPVEIRYFKNVVNFGRDRHALRVKIGRNVEDELITKWWRTHSYEGFSVEAEGPLKVLRNCNLGVVVSERLVNNGDQALFIVIGSVMGGFFLLVVVIAMVILVISRRSDPPVQDTLLANSPYAPTSQLQGRVTNQGENTDHIYDTIGSNTLTKLRKNFDADTLASSCTELLKNPSGSSAENDYDNTKTALYSSVCKPRKLPGIERFTARDMLPTSLLEQKEALREGCDLNSPVESHYVEMHGIVSRSSSFSK